MDAEIVEEVSRRLAERRVVTREELFRLTLRAALAVAGENLSDIGAEKVRELANSLIEDPISVRSLHFSEKFAVDGVEFYHPHTLPPTREDVETAYEEYLKSKRFADALPGMKEVMDAFFEGYEVKGEFFRVYAKSGRRYGVFFSLIDDALEDIEIHRRVAEKFDGEYVIAVPTERSVDPFLRFFKRVSEIVRRASMRVWVVNVEEKCIDPFIGYPRDLKLIKRFKNPKIGAIICSLWRVKVDDLD